MSVLRIMTLASAAMCFLAGMSGSAVSATYLESDAPGGRYSSSFAAPTQIGTGFENISGSASGDSREYISLTGLSSGAQTIRLTFDSILGTVPGYNAGVRVFAKEGSLFKWEFESGYEVGTGYQFSYNAPERKTVDIILGDGFSGALNLALYVSYGDLNYDIFAPSNAAVVAPATPSAAAVPLPAGVILLGSALASIGAFSALRLRKQRVT